MKKFTLKKYLKNEDQNRHTENALELTKMYGTPSEIKQMEMIAIRHKDTGYIDDNDYERRYEISNKYYQRLVHDANLE